MAATMLVASVDVAIADVGIDRVGRRLADDGDIRCLASLMWLNSPSGMKTAPSGVPGSRFTW
jgi:hypothetical protein